ncbi:MAG: heme lyase CcmF/NrfE family subunit [Anaerolineales bacterium]|nr:heme lyase CcmF/NrfE family subunit [Anaerolineales bacterium]
MLKDLGYTAALTAFLVSLYTLFAAYIGKKHQRSDWLKSARLGLRLLFPLLSTSLVSLLLLIVGDHFEIAYVHSVSSLELPVYLKAAALWGGQEGSLLFWAWCMSAFTAAAVRKNRFGLDFQTAFILVITSTLAFFLLIITFFDNPFFSLWQLADGSTAAAFFQPKFSLPVFPINGQGMNPLLRHPGMIFHPPLQYLGFVSYVIPFGFAMAALITGQLDNRWVSLSRKWSLAAWLFLSLGLVLGARWAYDVLGWGGYWGWDPVETAALMPWLTGTAFLHSIYVQEKRSMLRRWNVVLITLTYLLVLFGAFISRSGIISSVHSFASSTVSILFFFFISLTAIGVLLLLYRRWETLGSKNAVHSLLSREVFFLLNNAVFTGMTLVCFWGVLFPLISETFTGQKVTVGPAYYESATGPLWAVLLLLMGFAPLTVFYRTGVSRLRRQLRLPAAGLLATAVFLFLTGIRNIAALIGFPLITFTTLVTLAEFVRFLGVQLSRGESLLRALFHTLTGNRRRFGGYLIHLGIVMMAMGILGIELYQSDTQQTLAPGESASLGRYTVRYEGLSFYETDGGVQQAEAEVTVSAGGHTLGTYFPRRDYYPSWQQSVTVPAIRATLSDDLYIRLVDWGASIEEGATLKVYLNPLFNFLWLGTSLLLLGTLVAAGPILPGKKTAVKEVPHALRSS